MVSVASLLVAATPAGAAETPSCGGADAVASSLCRADRPMPSFTMSSTAPRAGREVALHATSEGRGVTFAWDLDGDGEYDDATGADVRTSFQAGQRTVGVRATDQFGRTGVQTRSFLVTTVNIPPTLNLDVGTGSVDHWFKSQDVTAVGEDADGQIRRVELDLDEDGVYEATSDGGRLAGRMTFTAPGKYVARARVTDDDGATATATATIDVGGPPSGTAIMAGVGWWSPVFAGDPVEISAGPRGFKRYEFDLDGDGTYEFDRGANADYFTQPYAAGDHEVGVRVTDGHGNTFTSRSSVAGLPRRRDRRRPPADPPAPGRSVGRRGGHAAVEAFPEYHPYTFAWDADDDGAFDDERRRSPAPGRRGPREPSRSPTPRPGRTGCGRRSPTRAGTRRSRCARSTWSSGLPVSPSFSSLRVPSVVKPGRPALLDPGSSRDGNLAWDLDGDGQFDDTPAKTDAGFRYTFTKPVNVAVKLTGAGGGTAIRTVDVNPLAGNLGPRADFSRSARGVPSMSRSCSPDARWASTTRRATMDDDTLLRDRLGQRR